MLVVTSTVLDMKHSRLGILQSPAPSWWTNVHSFRKKKTIQHKQLKPDNAGVWLCLSVSSNCFVIWILIACRSNVFADTGINEIMGLAQAIGWSSMMICIACGRWSDSVNNPNFSNRMQIARKLCCHYSQNVRVTQARCIESDVFKKCFWNICCQPYLWFEFELNKNRIFCVFQILTALRTYL